MSGLRTEAKLVATTREHHSSHIPYTIHHHHLYLYLYLYLWLRLLVTLRVSVGLMNPAKIEMWRCEMICCAGHKANMTLGARHYCYYNNSL